MSVPWAALLHAAQPYITDDARLLAPGACQLEVGKRVAHDRRETWILPACNPTGNLELTLGVNKTNPVDIDHATDYVVQGKGLLREMVRNDFGLGWVANVEAHRHPTSGQRRVGNVYAAVLVSRSWFDDVLIAHANAGVRQLRDEHRTAGTWGLAAEVNFTERFALIAETSDTTRSRRAYQAGLWFALVPDHLELDVSVGGDARDFRSTRYWTVGLRFIGAPFLK